MNDNRAHEYKNYVNSYGMQEIQREAGVARMLKGTAGLPKVEKTRQLVLRFVGVVITISLLLFFFR